MPLKRTPPHNTSELNMEDSVKSQQIDSYVNVNTSRQKKTRDKTLEGIMAEMHRLFYEYDEKQTAKLTILQSTINEVKTQFESITSSIQLLSDKYEDIKFDILNINKANKEQNACIKQLEYKLEVLERNANSSKIEIRNYPTQKGNKEELTKILQNIGNVIDSTIDYSEIKDIYLGYSKAKSPKPIVIEFTSTLKKEKIIKQYKKFNSKKESSNKLNTSHLCLNIPQKPIYISECLSTQGKKLFHLARDFSKSNGFTYCWSSYGKIYIRKQEGSPQIRINEEADMIKLRETTK